MLDKSENKRTAFSLGSVIVPAIDGTLKGLGFPVAELGEKALGIVIDTRSSKCLVQFPELKTSLWLGKDEMADVEARAALKEEAFLKILPDFQSSPKNISLVWWLWKLCQMLPLRYVLGFELGPLSELWSEREDELGQFYSGEKNINVVYLGLGLPELILPDWHEVENFLGKKLLFARFLPAGMHKLEVAIYLRAD